MKQYVYSFVLVVAALIAAPAQIFAQCVPLDSIPGGGIIDPVPFEEEVPGSGIRDTACVGEDFVTVFNLEAPETIEVLPGVPVEVNSIIVDTENALSGLPAGLDYTLTPSDGVIAPNTIACLEISGVPEAGTEGEYLLFITVGVSTFAGTLPFTLPDGELVTGEYRLVVRETGNPSCQPSSVTETSNADFSLNVFPNPAVNRITVDFNAVKNGTTQVSLLDVHGRIAQTQLVEASVGNNSVLLNTTDLPAGFYTLLLNDAADGLRSGVSSRVIINK